MRRFAGLALVALAAAGFAAADTEEQRLKDYIKQSRSSDEDNRTSAAYARAMDAPEGRTRVEAAKVWLRLELPVSDVAVALSGALRDPDEKVRKDAVDVVADMDKVPTPLVGVVKTALKDKSSDVRASDTAALAKVETVVDDRTKAATYLASIRDRDDVVRRNSIEGLDKLGVGSPEVVAELIRALKDKDDFVRAAAAKALGDVKARDAIPALRQAWKTDKDTFVQIAARDALQKLGEKVY